MLEWADMNALAKTIETVKQHREAEQARVRATTVHLPEDLHAALSLRCCNHAQSESTVIAEALRQHLGL